MFPHLCASVGRQHLELYVPAEAERAQRPLDAEDDLSAGVPHRELRLAQSPLLLHAADGGAGRGGHLQVLQAAREAAGLAVERAVEVYHL